MRSSRQEPVAEQSENTALEENCRCGDCLICEKRLSRETLVAVKAVPQITRRMIYDLKKRANCGWDALALAFYHEGYALTAEVKELLRESGHDII